MMAEEETEKFYLQSMYFQTISRDKFNLVVKISFFNTKDQRNADFLVGYDVFVDILTSSCT